MKAGCYEAFVRRALSGNLRLAATVMDLFGQGINARPGVLGNNREEPEREPPASRERGHEA